MIVYSGDNAAFGMSFWVYDTLGFGVEGNGVRFHAYVLDVRGMTWERH